MEVKPCVENIVILKVEGDEGEIKAKRSILAEKSEFFKKLFASDPECKLITLRMDIVVSFVIMKGLVDIMSSNELKGAEKTVCDLLHAADNLKVVSPLMEIIANYVLSNNNWEHVNFHQVMNCLKILNPMSQYVTIAHKTEYFKYRNENQPRPIEISPISLVTMFFDEFMFNPWVMKLNFQSIQRIMSFDHLPISEKDAFRTIKIWIQHDYRERAKYLVPLLKCVRFDPNMELTFIFRDMIPICKSVESKKFIATLLVLREKPIESVRICLYGSQSTEIRHGYEYRHTAKELQRYNGNSNYPRTFLLSLLKKY